MQPHPTTVCVLAARGMAAISSIALTGPDAHGILSKVFQSGMITGRGSVTVPAQGVVHGSIVDEGSVVDEVVVGCEEPDRCVIHCHGNPLLVERIVKLIQSHGAVLTDVDNVVYSRLLRSSKNTIEAEAKHAMQKSATLLGVKILQAQINAGLSKWTQQTLESIDSLDKDEIESRCAAILGRSEIAKRIIQGVRIVIAGPPNSGKSTLLNCLAGQQQVIVSDTAGTTRDWVSVTCMMGPVRAEFIDTAGLDDSLSGKEVIQQTAQQITKDLIQSCHLILYVQDVTADSGQNAKTKINTIRPVVYVYNKCDLPGQDKGLQTQGPESVFISAKENDGIDQLAQTILSALKVTEIQCTDPVLFTPRQVRLLGELAAGPRTPRDILNELLHSDLSL